MIWKRAELPYLSCFAFYNKEHLVGYKDIIFYDNNKIIA